jgi:exopolysaccharide biosynthesis polyprenyl glycosylphosphotransferase
MMQRDIARQANGGRATVASELPAQLPVGGTMALLGVAELMLSFTVIYAVLQAPGVATGLPLLVPTVLQSLPRGPFELAAIITLTFGAVGLSIGLYRRDVYRHAGRMAVAAVLATAAAFIVMTLLVGSIERGLSLPQALTIGRVIGAWMLTIGVMRAAVGLVNRYRHPARRILILGEPNEVRRVHGRLQSRLGRRFDAVVSHARDLAQDLAWQHLRREELWAVVMATPLEAEATEALLDAKLRGLRVVSGTDFQERNLGRIDLDGLTSDAFLTADGFEVDNAFDRTKRLCDIALSVAMIVLTLPLMLLTALAIKADTPGPVLYRQSRTGAFGKTFTVFKFRSMTANAEAGGKALWAQKADPRVTRVGRFIRATRIDELPQLWNILRGEMSLVGPRPERPHFVEQLGRAIPFYEQRSYVKPGLTGWAQVNYPYGASVEDAREKLAYDLYYVKHRSIWLDLKILLATVRVVLTRDGAR